MAGMVGVKNEETNALARPPALAVNRDSLRVYAAAWLNSGARRSAGTGASAVQNREKNGVATCGIKRLGSGCKKDELLKARAWAVRVRPV